MKDSFRSPSPLVKSILDFRSGGSVIDIGAGWGRHAAFLAGSGFEVTAVEPDAEILAAMKTKIGLLGLSLTYQQSDLFAVPVDRAYDVVVTTMVLHFLSDKDEVSRGIQKLKDLTLGRGITVVSVMLDKEVNNPKPYLFQPGELQKYFHDWNILRYDEELGLPYQPSYFNHEIRSYAARLIAEKPIPSH